MTAASENRSWKAAGLNYDTRTILERNFCTKVFFNLLNHRWVLEQNLYLCRTHFDGYLSSSNLELQTKMELRLLPSSLTYLITYWLIYLIRVPALTILSKFADLKYHKCLWSSSLCYTILSNSIFYNAIILYLV